MNLSKLKLTARIITGNAEYRKELHNGYMTSPIWKICTETAAQFNSEQYIFQKGFVRGNQIKGHDY